MTYGSVESVEARKLGSELTAAAAVGASTLAVEITFDFDEDGGLLLLNGATLAYTTVDEATATITLTAPLATAAAVDDPVQVVDDTGAVAVEWVANVATDEGDTKPATIPTALIPYFPEGSYADPVWVRIGLDEDGGGYVVRSQPDREASFDGGAVWNPHSSRRMNQVTIPTSASGEWVDITSWSDVETDAITLDAGFTVQVSGFYSYRANVAFVANSTGGRRVRILLNGVDEVAFGATAADPTGVSFITAQFADRLAEGDRLTVQVFQNSGAGLDLSAGSNRCAFVMYRVSV